MLTNMSKAFTPGSRFHLHSNSLDTSCPFPDQEQALSDFLQSDNTTGTNAVSLSYLLIFWLCFLMINIFALSVKYLWLWSIGKTLKFLYYTIITIAAVNSNIQSTWIKQRKMEYETALWKSSILLPIIKTLQSGTKNKLRDREETWSIGISMSEICRHKIIDSKPCLDGYIWKAIYNPLVSFHLKNRIIFREKIWNLIF